MLKIVHGLDLEQATESVWTKQMAKLRYKCTLLPVSFRISSGIEREGKSEAATNICDELLQVYIHELS